MDKKYPIGDFDYNANYDVANVSEWINEIRALPGRIKVELDNITEEQLHTPYRENGWTVSEVIHHLVDSHMNAFIRVKLALTENNPTIKPYNEATWATLADYSAISVKDALSLLEVLHSKWCAILDSMTREQFQRTFQHPESGINYTLIKSTAMYAWHSNHHLTHIKLVTNS